MPSESYSFRLPTGPSGSLVWPVRDNSYSRVCTIDCAEWLDLVLTTISGVSAAANSLVSVTGLQYTGTTFSFTQSGGDSGSLVPVSFSLGLATSGSEQITIEIPIALATEDVGSVLLGAVHHVTTAAGTTGSSFGVSDLAQLDLSTLPTSNPGAGKIWVNGGVLQVGV